MKQIDESLAVMAALQHARKHVGLKRALRNFGLEIWPVTAFFILGTLVFVAAGVAEALARSPDWALVWTAMGAGMGLAASMVGIAALVLAGPTARTRELVESLTPEQVIAVAEHPKQGLMLFTAQGYLLARAPMFRPYFDPEFGLHDVRLNEAGDRLQLLLQCGTFNKAEDVLWPYADNPERGNRLLARLKAVLDEERERRDARIKKRRR